MLFFQLVVTCQYENDVDNRESPLANDLFPNGCDKSSNNSTDAARCKATTNCKGQETVQPLQSIQTSNLRAEILRHAHLGPLRATAKCAIKLLGVCH